MEKQNIQEFLARHPKPNFGDNPKNEFHRLCILHKIEEINEEIKKISSNISHNTSAKLQILMEEKKNLLEKMENYPI